LDGEKKIVNLPNDPELIDLLTKNSVDILFCLKAMKVSGLRQLAVFFPSAAIGLFFLLRRPKRPRQQTMNFSPKPECRWNRKRK